MAANAHFKNRHSKDRRKSIRRANDQELVVAQEKDLERVTLTRLSLLLVDYENKHSKGGIRRFMNRLLAMTQDDKSHRIILVLHQESDDEDYRVLFHTMHDPLWQKTLENQLKQEKGIYLASGCNEKKGKNHLFLNHELYQDYICPFFKNLYLIFLDSYLEDRDNPSLEKFSYKFVKKRRLDIKFSIPTLLNELQNSESTLYRTYSPDMLLAKFEYRQKKWDKGHYIVDTPNISFEKLYSSWNSEWDANYISSDFTLSQNFYDHHLKKIEAMINAEYIKIYDSSFLWDEGFGVSNIFFTVRMFSRDKLRHANTINPDGYYSYDVYTILPRRQRRHLYIALKQLSKDSFQGELFSGRDDFFWEQIKTKNGRKQIVIEMQNRWGDHTRALSDMGYCGGFLRVAVDPFSLSSANRFGADIWGEAQRAPDKLLNENLKFLDYRRMVYHHYMMSLVAPQNKNKNLFLVPGFAGGSPWCCMAFLVYAKNNDLHQKWVNGYILYHSIYKQVMANFRKRLKEIFVNEIKELYDILSKEVYDDHIRNDRKSTIPLECFIEEFNIRSKYLCRIYPFSLIKLKKGNKIRHNLYGEKLSVDLIDNPFFLKNMDFPFLNKNEIEALFNSFLNRVQEASDNQFDAAINIHH